MRVNPRRGQVERVSPGEDLQTRVRSKPTPASFVERKQARENWRRLQTRVDIRSKPTPAIFVERKQAKKTDLLQPPLLPEWVIGGAGAEAGAPLVAEMIDREADRHVEVVVVVAEAAVTAARSEESPPAGMSAVSVSSSLTTAAKTSSATSRILLTETPSPRVPRCGSERFSTIARARSAPRT